MAHTLASAITRSASLQTYCTIRFLVDRPRVEDAFRAYAYFRWVDDVLDAVSPDVPMWGDTDRQVAARFLERQQRLLERALRGEVVTPADRHEAMLIDLVRHDRDARLEVYLRQMMRVMAFDVRRRGTTVTEPELTGYTHALAVAVTEAMHHFIGSGGRAPDDETRYQAVTGAHILHMLRDTHADLRAGYINVPRELLTSAGIGPEDIHSDAYRAWVQARVELAREALRSGRRYFALVESARHRLAGLAYIARFEWVADRLVRDDFRIRTAYPQPALPRLALAALRAPR